MISLQNLSVRFGPQILFENVSVQFNPGNRYGIVGANGAGKSTLFSVITGSESNFTGQVSVPKDASVGVLSQDHFRYNEESLVDVVIEGNGRLSCALKERDALHAGEDEELSGYRLMELEEIISEEDGYTAESRACKLLSGLGISSEIHFGAMNKLSGGYRLRVLLAQALFKDPDILLLDEPTNHLDIVSIAWLENYLTNTFKGTLLLISHDRAFINSVCDFVADLDYNSIILYPGNYDDFMESKLQIMEQKQKEARQLEKKSEDLQDFIDRFKAKASKARQAQSRVKQLEKIELPDIVRSSRRYPRFRFIQSRPSGKDVLRVNGVSKSYLDKPVLKNITLEINRGEKVALLGPNGIGKSTLAKIISGKIKADSGEFQWGYEANLAYFSQDHKEILNKEKISVYDWLYSFYPSATIGEIRGLLGNVLFTNDDVKKQLSSISGGESARLMLAGITMQKPNIILADEPTNHLDLESISALEDAFNEFEGTLIFISHDRNFVSNIATRIIELHPEGLHDFRGTYAEFLENFGTDYLERVPGFRKKEKLRKKDRDMSDHDYRKMLTGEFNKQKNMVELLESRIQDTEQEIGSIETKFSGAGFFQKTSQKEANALKNRQDELKKLLEKLLSDWEEQNRKMQQMQKNLVAVTA